MVIQMKNGRQFIAEGDVLHNAADWRGRCTVKYSAPH